MVTEKTLMDLGFIKDKNNSKIKELSKNNVKLKEIHIDIYPDNSLDVSSSPFMLLLRTIEKNVVVESDGSRIVLLKEDKDSVLDTYLSNVPISSITGCFFKVFDAYSEFIVNIQNVYYKVTTFK